MVTNFYTPVHKFWQSQLHLGCSLLGTGHIRTGIQAFHRRFVFLVVKPKTARLQLSLTDWAECPLSDNKQPLVFTYFDNLRAGLAELQDVALI